MAITILAMAAKISTMTITFADLVQIPSSLSDAISALEKEISASEGSLKAFANSSSCWENLLLVCTGLVVLGLVAEVVLVVREHREEMHDWSRGVIHAPDRPSTANFVLALFASTFIFLGVSGELWAGIKLAEINRELRGMGDDLRNKSERLVALLGEETAQLQLENTRLLALIQPRSLSLDQQREIGKDLSAYNGRNVALAWVDPESHALALQLKDALKFAKIAAVIPPESARVIPGFSTGRAYSYTYILPPLETGIRINWPPAQDKLGRALCHALEGKLSGLKCSSHPASVPTVGFLPMGIAIPPEPGVLISVLGKPLDTPSDKMTANKTARAK